MREEIKGVGEVDESYFFDGNFNQKENLTERARERILLFHSALEAEFYEPSCRIVPETIEHKISRVCFLSVGYQTALKSKLNRSPSSWLRQKAPRAKIFTTPFPLTLLQRENFFEFLKEREVVWKESVVFKAPNGGVFLSYFKQAIPPDMALHIEMVTNLLIADAKPNQKTQAARGDGEFYLFGYHRFSAPETSTYSHMTLPPFVKWTNNIKPYVEFIRSTVLA